MTEKELQNLIRIELSKLGYTVFRANVGKIKMKDGRWFDCGLPRGYSDLHAIKDGKIFFFEVKVKPNKPSQEQLNFIEQMKKKGCIAGVVYSMEDVLELTGEGNCIICGSKTINRLESKNGSFICCCNFPKECNMELYRKGLLY